MSKVYMLQDTEENTRKSVGVLRARARFCVPTLDNNGEIVHISRPRTLSLGTLWGASFEEAKQSMDNLRRAMKEQSPNIADHQVFGKFTIEL